MTNNQWIKAEIDSLPSASKEVDIKVGLKIMCGYVLVKVNSINYYFENIKTGCVVDGFDVDGWRYSD